MKVGDLVRYKNKEASFWTGVVADVFTPEWERNDIPYVKVVWIQDPSCHGVIRANLMEVISESR